MYRVIVPESPTIESRCPPAIAARWWVTSPRLWQQGVSDDEHDVPSAHEEGRQRRRSKGNAAHRRHDAHPARMRRLLVFSPVPDPAQYLLDDCAYRQAG